MNIDKDKIRIEELRETGTTTMVRAYLMHEGHKFSSHVIVSNRVIKYYPQAVDEIKDILKGNVIRAIEQWHTTKTTTR